MTSTSDCRASSRLNSESVGKSRLRDIRGRIQISVRPDFDSKRDATRRREVQGRQTQQSRIRASEVEFRVLNQSSAWREIRCDWNRFVRGMAGFAGLIAKRAFGVEFAKCTAATNQSCGNWGSRAFGKSQFLQGVSMRLRDAFDVLSHIGGQAGGPHHQSVRLANPSNRECTTESPARDFP